MHAVTSLHAHYFPPSIAHTKKAGGNRQTSATQPLSLAAPMMEGQVRVGEAACCYRLMQPDFRFTHCRRQRQNDKRHRAEARQSTADVEAQAAVAVIVSALLVELAICLSPWFISHDQLAPNSVQKSVLVSREGRELLGKHIIRRALTCDLY